MTCLVDNLLSLFCKRSTAEIALEWPVSLQFFVGLDFRGGLRGELAVIMLILR